MVYMCLQLVLVLCARSGRLPEGSKGWVRVGPFFRAVLIALFLSSLLSSIPLVCRPISLHLPLHSPLRFGHITGHPLPLKLVPPPLFSYASSVPASPFLTSLPPPATCLLLLRFPYDCRGPLPPPAVARLLPPSPPRQRHSPLPLQLQQPLLSTFATMPAQRKVEHPITDLFSPFAPPRTPPSPPTHRWINIPTHTVMPYPSSAPTTAVASTLHPSRRSCVAPCCPSNAAAASSCIPPRHGIVPAPKEGGRRLHSSSPSVRVSLLPSPPSPAWPSGSFTPPPPHLLCCT